MASKMTAEKKIFKLTIFQEDLLPVLNLTAHFNQEVKNEKKQKNLKLRK